MNALVDWLNEIGSRASTLMWPWSVQVSLLVVLLWLLETALGHRLRPAIRHALWLLVPLKLLLPPTTAFPTGLGYWFSWPETHNTPAVGTVSLRYLGVMPPSSGPAPMRTSAQGAPVQAWQSIHPAGWLALAWLSGSTALLGVVITRTRRSHAMCRGRWNTTNPTTQGLSALLEETRLTVGIGRPVTLLLVEEGHSPAICGVWRPAVLLPSRLAESLSKQQLRTVLLHELIHARRGDLWVNAGQVLLQILWWWHPLVWFANARLRAAREESVDDAVVAMLGPEGDAYPQALLTVARFVMATRRPSLGLVGILESRSALRTRIERLLGEGFKPRPRLGPRGILAVASLSLVALPMAPGKSAPPTAETVQLQKFEAQMSAELAGLRLQHAAAAAEFAALQERTRSGDPLSPQEELRATELGDRLVALQRRRADLGDMQEIAIQQGTQIGSGLLWGASGRGLSQGESAPALGSNPAAEPGATVRSLRLALAIARADLASMLTTHHEKWPAIVDLRKQVDSLEHRLAALKGPSPSPSQPPGADPARNHSGRSSVSGDGKPAATNYPSLGSSSGPGTGETPTIPRTAAPSALFTRTFRLDWPALVEGLEQHLGRDLGEDWAVWSLALRDEFMSAGFSVDPPNTLYCNLKSGLLMVRGTEKEVGLVTQALDRLTSRPASVVVEALVVELADADFLALGLDRWDAARPKPPSITDAERRDVRESPGGSRVLSEPELRILRKAITQRQGISVLSAPRVTTLSGRAAEVSVAETTARPAMPLSFRLEILPEVQPDGRSIRLEATAHLNQIQWLGKLRPEEAELPSGAATTGERAFTNSAVVPDGDALVLGDLSGARAPSHLRRVVVIVQATLIDPAGNRLHPESGEPAGRR